MQVQKLRLQRGWSQQPTMPASTANQSVFQWLPFFGPEWEKKQVEKHLGRPL